MKSEWKQVQLSDIADLTVGFVGTMAQHYVDDGIVFLRSTNIEPFKMNLDDVKYISQEFNQKIKKSQLNFGDVVIVRTGKPGACAVIPQIENSWNCSDLVIIRPNQEKILPLYLAAYINLAYGVINAHLVGAVQQHFNVGSAKKLVIDLPPISTQKQIVGIIQAINDKIELNQRINDNLERQASALIEKYFEDTDTLTILSDIMRFENGFAFQSKTYLPTGQYRIVTIKNVQDGRINPQDAACINDLPAKMKPGCVLHIGDVLLSLTGNVGRVGIVCEDNLLLNQRVAKIVPNENALLPFLYFVFRHPSIKIQIESIAKGTAQLNLSPVETLGLGIPYQRESAHQLAGRLFPLYCSIIQNSQENLVLATTRDALLPKLMSGELDVSNLQL